MARFEIRRYRVRYSTQPTALTTQCGAWFAVISVRNDRVLAIKSTREEATNWIIEHCGRYYSVVGAV